MIKVLELCARLLLKRRTAVESWFTDKSSNEKSTTEKISKENITNGKMFERKNVRKEKESERRNFRKEKSPKGKKSERKKVQMEKSPNNEKSDGYFSENNGLRKRSASVSRNQVPKIRAIVESYSTCLKIPSAEVMILK